MRVATISDFTQGTTLFTEEGYGFTLIRLEMDGIWLGRGTQGQGDKCIFVDEARFYSVK